MKRLISLALVAIVLMLSMTMLLTSCSDEEEIVLYVYNWGEYISDGSDGSRDVNLEFEKYCERVLGKKVKVNYSTFSSNEDMYAKIESGAATYDVIVPSDYMIQRMVKEGLLAPLDMELIPNYADIDDRFKGENVYYEEETYDPATDQIYSVPYFYGMIGVIYNQSIVPEDEKSIGSWDLMWDEDYAGDILQFNNSRDAFGTALYRLGYSVNHATEEQWREALDLLKTQKDLVQGYVMDEIFNKMQSGSAAVAAYYAGDFLSMYADNEELAFFYPEEGTNSYIDAMCVPKTSRNKDLAMAYINFMCEKENAIANALYTYYASPLTSVVNDPDYRAEMMDVHEDAMDILYNDAVSVPTEAYLNLTPDQLDLLNDLWEELKVESSVGVGIYIGCGVIIAALIGLVVYHILKKRRWSKLYD